MSGSCEPDAAAGPSGEPSAGDGDGPHQLPAHGRLLGLDFGTRRIGIALSDDAQRIASPLENYSRLRLEDDARRLKSVAAEYRAIGLVVGLPLHMGGEEGQKAREARQFGAWAASVTNLPVVFWDERLSSWLAEDALKAARLSPKKRKMRLDKIAAQIMLQSYLGHRESRLQHESDRGQP